MTFTPRELESHVNWGGANIADPSIWTIELTLSDHRELDRALKAAKAWKLDRAKALNGNTTYFLIDSTCNFS